MAKHSGGVQGVYRNWMDKNAKTQFADRLRKAMIDAGLEPKAAVLERGFNLHFFGPRITAHGVARWLRGETVPPFNKVASPALWLKVPVETKRFTVVRARAKRSSRKRAGAPRLGIRSANYSRRFFACLRRSAAWCAR